MNHLQSSACYHCFIHTQFFFFKHLFDGSVNKSVNSMSRHGSHDKLLCEKPVKIFSFPSLQHC